MAKYLKSLSTNSHQDAWTWWSISLYRNLGKNKSKSTAIKQFLTHNRSAEVHNSLLTPALVYLQKSFFLGPYNFMFYLVTCYYY